ncbi:two component sensor kinase [Lactococcus hodotermopsidis]|uniref:histidine kinase n=1 Tax=Pseudolactococcus hodotermopsidis TaxID=2709157 RepID=A0A6A0BFY2_9LACT|nr:HAMP domain-containing sensor histidine kinase [Lactococcus hodotermopsidis]GFH43181.1 two component sensor kinase [Lactococcus hodotermopsidis]
MTKRKPIENDPRVKKRHFTWLEISLTYFILLTLATGQSMIYAEYVALEKMPLPFIFGMLGYWAIVTGVFCWITSRQKIRAFERPMRRLSNGAKEVAKGDFSVYLEPFHTADKHDFIDVMYEDFNTMVEELGSIETLKNDFISNVSHEIKTPLAIIQNYAAALQSEYLTDDERDEYAQTIITAAKKLNQLVANILKLSKLDNQEIMPEIQPFDLSKQLPECILVFEDILDKKEIELEVDLEERQIITADKGMLEIVWHNLLSNALKFTDNGGKIAIKQISDEDSVTVTISDNGCGMNAETVNHLFEKFYQGDTSHSAEGNGLGMALTLRVIELTGGSIKVTSELGQGATFVVKFRK